MADWVLEETAVVDVLEADRPHRTGAYVILDDGVTVVDPGAARGIPRLVEGIRALGVDPGDIRRVVVTHVHLDHAGGVGTLVRDLPRATVFCHPRAAAHLADPGRLLEGARAVYGERLERLFGAVLPVPAWQIRAVEDLGRVAAGRHALRLFDSPGHARHHATVLDERTGGLFTGDAVGIRYDPGFTGWPKVYGLPTTSPSAFDPPAMLATLDRLERLGAVAVLHTHFGVSPPAEAFAFTRRGVEAMLRLLDRFGDRALTERDVRRAWEDWVREDLEAQGLGDVDLDPLGEDLRLDALGLYGYWRRRREAAGSPAAGPGS
jgi:glyoxylase-like metal-dependent hydrolase (beta-lactamase superfamily II)